MTRVIAIDWSGDKKHAADKIWAAVVEEGRLTELRNGRGPQEIVQFLVESAADDSNLVVGFDFGFSFPSWFVEEYGSVEAMWLATGDESFANWREEAAPFFGTTHSTYAGRGTQLRLTDEIMKAKSVFKVSGNGSVGTGSIKGMPILRQLARSGLSIWPFMPATLPTVVEIYPRACLDTEQMTAIASRFSKTNPNHRRQYLARNVSGVWLDLAASTEDSFDAATSALAMWHERNDLENLPEIKHETLRREGIIWSPTWRALHEEWLSA